jgi:hypothetical protein
MVTAATAPVSPSTTTPAETDAGIQAMARALKQKREEAQALVRLVEQSNPAGDKGRHVDYYG